MAAASTKAHSVRTAHRWFPARAYDTATTAPARSPWSGLGGADRDEQPAVDVEGQVLDVERDKRRARRGRERRGGVGGGALQLVAAGGLGGVCSPAGQHRCAAPGASDTS